MKRIWVVVLTILVMGLVAVFVWFRSMGNFLFDDSKAIGGMHTKIFTFKPYYLWSYEDQGGVYGKVFYLTKSGTPKIITLWLIGNYNNTRLESVVYVRGDGSVVTLSNMKEVRENLHFGKRVSMDYITGELVEIPNAYYDEKVCVVDPRICQVNNFVKANENFYKHFSITGYWNKNYVLPPLVLRAKLDK